MVSLTVLSMLARSMNMYTINVAAAVQCEERIRDLHVLALEKAVAAAERQEKESIALENCVNEFFKRDARNRAFAIVDGLPTQTHLSRLVAIDELRDLAATNDDCVIRQLAEIAVNRDAFMEDVDQHLAEIRVLREERRAHEAGFGLMNLEVVVEISVNNLHVREAIRAEKVKNIAEKAIFTQWAARNTLDRGTVDIPAINIFGNENDEVFATSDIVSLGYSRKIRDLVDRESEIVELYKGMNVKLYKNKTYKTKGVTSIIKLQFDNDCNLSNQVLDDIDENGLEIISVTTQDGVLHRMAFVHHYFRDKVSYWAVRLDEVSNEGKHALFSETNKEVHDKMLAAPGASIVRYGFIEAGPSNIRQDNLFLNRMYDGESMQSFRARMATMINHYNGSLYTFAKRGGKKQLAKMAKLLGRSALTMTPNTVWTNMQSFVYFGGEFNGSDGTWWVNARLVREFLNIKCGKNIFTEEDALSLDLQARSNVGPVKGLADVTTDNLINDLVNHHESNGINVQVMTHKEFEIAYAAGDINEKSMCLVTETCVEDGFDAVLDSTTVKGAAAFGNMKNWTINIIDVFRSSEAQTNKQIASTLEQVPGFVDAFRKEAFAYVDERIAKALSELPRTIIDMSNAYASTLVNDMCPAFTNQDAHLFGEKFQNLLNEISNVISNFNYPIDGTGRRIKTDFVKAWFDIKLIAKTEVVLPYAKKGEYAAYRNPHSAIGSFTVVNNIGVGEYCHRVWESELSDAVKADIVYKIHSYGSACAIATGDRFFMVCADGADCDGDFMTFIRAAWWLAFQKQERSVGVNNDNAKDTSAKDTEANIRLFGQMISDQLHGAKDADGIRRAPERVGELCNRVRMIQGVINTPKDWELARKVYLTNAGLGLSEVDGAEEYTCKYCGEDVYAQYGAGEDIIFDIFDADCKKIQNKFHGSDLSVKSFVNFLKDCSVAYTSIIGRNIDAAKNYQTVWTLLAAALSGKDENGDRIKGATVLKDELTIRYELVMFDDGGKTEIGTRALRSTGKNIHLVKSPLSIMRQDVFKYAADRLMEVLGQKNGACASEIEHIYRGNPLANKCDKFDLVSLKAIYNHLTNEKNYANTQEKNEICDYIANTVLLATDSMNVSERYLALKRVCAKVTKNDGLVFDGFYKTMMPELVNGVINTAKEEGYKYSTLAGYPVYLATLSMDTKTVHFTNSQLSDDKNVICKKVLNGNFSIVKDGKQYYACNDVRAFYPERVADDRVAFELNTGLSKQDAEELLAQDVVVVNAKKNLSSIVEKSGHSFSAMFGAGHIRSFNKKLSGQKLNNPTDDKIQAKKLETVRQTRLMSMIDRHFINIDKVYQVNSLVPKFNDDGVEIGTRVIVRTFVLGRLGEHVVEEGQVVLQKPVQTDNLPSFDEICGMFN